MNETKELSPREQRILSAEAKNKSKPLTENEKKEQFRLYFKQIKRKLNLEADLENIIWLHFKAAGFDTENKFDDGLKHFGYKL